LASDAEGRKIPKELKTELEALEENLTGDGIVKTLTNPFVISIFFIVFFSLTYFSPIISHALFGIDSALIGEGYSRIWADFNLGIVALITLEVVLLVVLIRYLLGYVSEGYEHVWKNWAIRDDDAGDLWQLLKNFNSSLSDYRLLSVVIGIGVNAAYGILQLTVLRNVITGTWFDISVNPFGFIVVKAFWCAIWILFFVVLWKMLCITFFTFMLFHEEKLWKFKGVKLHYNPLHTDRSGGLSPLGTLSFRLVLPLLVFNIFRVVELFWSESQRVMVPTFVIIVTSIVTIAIFFIPITFTHEVMKREREHFLKGVNGMIGTRLKELLGDGEVDFDEARAMSLVNFHHIAKRAPAWPFDNETFVQFIFLILIPIFSVLVSFT